jgi:hypothetical protein
MATTIGLFVSTATSAQFTNAVSADNVYSLSTTPTIVNNDILDDGNDIFRVTAFSDAVGPRSGIMWECYFAGNNYSGDLPLNYYSVYSGAVVNYIDVSIAKDINSNVIHALAVFSVNSIYGNQWLLEDFIWNGTAFISNPSIPQWSIAYGNFGTTIHIDANTNGEFIVVYDDAGGNLYHITGILAGGVNLFSLINNTAYGSFPDITLSHDNSNFSYAYLSYIDNSILYIDKEYFTTLNTSSFSSPSMISNIGVLVSRPRISSPNIYGGAFEYEVVFECTNNARTHYEIRGYNNTAAVGFKYNIGTFVPGGNTTSVPNHHPVVAYDQYNHVNVGWVLDNSSGAISGAFQSHYPIVVPCDNTGTPTVSTYWETPRAGANFGNYFSIPYLALSGRHSLTYDSTFFSTYSLTNADFLTKSAIINSASSLKVADVKKSSTNNLQVFIQAADPLSKYQTTIWNTQGKEVSSRYLNLDEIEIFIKSNLDNLPSGIYFTRLINDKNQTAFTGKITN